MFLISPILYLTLFSESLLLISLIISKNFDIIYSLNFLQKFYKTSS